MPEAPESHGHQAILVPCCFVYDAVGEHALLSNYAITAISVDRAVWPTAEHLFQAAKFEDAQVRREVRCASSGEMAKAIAWDPANAHLLMSDWDGRRVDIMRRALTLKFDQNPAARAELAATWPQPILENSPSDGFWGIGPMGRGENMLGHLLEEQRARVAALPSLFEVPPANRPPGVGGPSRSKPLRALWRHPASVFPSEGGLLVYKGFRQLDIRRLLLGDAGSTTAEPIRGRIFERHAELLDAKYADYRWTDDARSVVPHWVPSFEAILGERLNVALSTASVIAVGAGSANEAENIWRQFGSKVTLVDWGHKLAENCAREAPQSQVVRRRAEHLHGVADASYHIYCSLRTYDSAFIDIAQSLKEAARVLADGGLLIVSVSDGYLTTDGRVIRGQIGQSGTIVRSNSWNKLLEVVARAQEIGFHEFSFFDLRSEIGICARAPGPAASGSTTDRAAGVIS